MKKIKAVAIILARGGSKRIPQKNILEVNGKPLIAYTIEAAKKSKYIEDVFVSTDDQSIKEVSESFGSQVIDRPEKLATDTAKSIDALYHAAEVVREKYDFEVLVLLQPTSPLRNSEDIDKTIELVTSGADSAQTVCDVREHPSLMVKISEEGNLIPIDSENHLKRSQDFDKIYIKNGAVYAVRSDLFFEEKTLYGKDHKALIMPRERSIDIDEPEDIEIFKTYLGK